MKPQTLGVAVACCIGVVALALFLFSGCYLAQDGTAVLSMATDAMPASPAELDGGIGTLSGINDASFPVDDMANSLELDAGAELLELDGCLPWELALPSSCPRGAP